MSAEVTIRDVVIPAKAGTHSGTPYRRHFRESGNPVSFARYPKYKESSVEWLGEVPAHWEIAPFKRATTNNDGGVWGDEPDGEGDTIVLRSTEQTVDGNWSIDDPAVRKLTERERADALLKADDLVITKSSGSALHIGKTTLVTAEIAQLGCCYSNFMQRVRTSCDLLPKLAWYVLNSGLARTQFDLLSNSTTGLANLNAAMIGRLVLVLPPVDEQETIVTFLDRETAKIDALIAEQEKLVALLKEKRQALISHAVTKGLDPDAPMKDSGIEWLGQVPEHWAVTRCGRFVSILSGFAFPSSGFDHDGNGTRLLRGINVGVGTLRWDDVVYWRREPQDGLDDYQMKTGDIVIGMDRPLISEGIRVAKLTTNDIPSLLLQRVASLRTSARLNGDFFAHLLATPMFTAHFSPNTTGVSVPHISPEQIASFVIPVPPLSEQEEIVSRLADGASQLEILMVEVERNITLLKERRAALISAAVTGKIDVRGLVAAEIA